MITVAMKTKSGAASRVDDYAKARDSWNAGADFIVVGGDVLPKGATINNTTLRGERIVFQPNPDALGSILVEADT